MSGSVLGGLSGTVVGVSKCQDKGLGLSALSGAEKPPGELLELGHLEG